MGYVRGQAPPKVWPVSRAMVGKGKSRRRARRGKKPELLAEGLESDSWRSRPWGGRGRC